MPPKKGKLRQEISLTPKQKSILEQLSKDTDKGYSEIIGQMLENYSDSFNRKYGT